MTRLLLQAHPVADSYNATLLRRIAADESDDVVVVRIGQGDRLDEAALRSARHLTAIHPTWWGGPPAMLLGELERVLGPWIDHDAPVATSPLRSVARLEVVTTHGSPRRVNRLQGEPGLQLWKRTILPLCAPRARFDWRALYGMDRLDDAGRRAFLDSLTAR